jgi:hypothetical protein
MSQELLSQKMKRTCDGCGTTYEWDMVGLNAEIIKQLENWYTIIREIFFDGEFRKMMVQCCSLACTPVAAVKLALPPQQEEPADNIDLASLRASNYTKPN